MKTASIPMRLKAALMKIENLEEIIADQRFRIRELEKELADAEDYDLFEVDDDVEDDLRWIEMRDFLSDIGFDPTNLPSTLGERMAIARLLEAAAMFK